MTSFWCEGQSSDTSSKLQESDPPASVVPSEEDQNHPRSNANAHAVFSHVRKNLGVFFAITQQLSRHTFSRIIPRHFGKFNHSSTTILVTTT